MDEVRISEQDLLRKVEELAVRVAHLELVVVALRRALAQASHNPSSERSDDERTAR